MALNVKLRSLFLVMQFDRDAQGETPNCQRSTAAEYVRYCKREMIVCVKCRG